MNIATKINEATVRINCVLELERKIVGVKFLFSKEEYNLAHATEAKTKMPYCVLVKVAMLGYARKANLEKFGCLSAGRALGLLDPTEDWLSGQQYAQKDMYQDLGIARKVVKNTTCVRHKAYGVMVKPLEAYIHMPDVVIIVTNPYNVMRLIQGYTYKFGTYKNYKIIGNQALCSECTAYPFESNNINISTLCAGTRYMAGWGKDEMALGIPFNKYWEMIDGLYQTVNIMEPNRDKKIIEQKMEHNGLNDFGIEYDKNYYTGLYLKSNR